MTRDLRAYKARNNQTSVLVDYDVPLDPLGRLRALIAEPSVTGAALTWITPAELKNRFARCSWAALDPGVREAGQVVFLRELRPSSVASLRYVYASRARPRPRKKPKGSL